MKKRKIIKKLQLNKITVVNLDDKGMKQVLGGDFESLDCMPTGEPGTICCETYRTCQPPQTYTCWCGDTEYPICQPTIRDTYCSCIYC